MNEVLIHNPALYIPFTLKYFGLIVLGLSVLGYELKKLLLNSLSLAVFYAVVIETFIDPLEQPFEFILVFAVISLTIKPYLKLTWPETFIGMIAGEIVYLIIKSIFVNYFDFNSHHMEFGYRMKYQLTITGVMFALSYLAWRYKVNVSEFFKGNLALKRSEAVFLLLICFSYGLMAYRFMANRMSLFDFILLIVVVTLTIFTLLYVLRNAREKLEKEKKIVQMETILLEQKSTIEASKEIISLMRKEKHDLTNHLQVIYGLAETNSIEELKRYINDWMDDIEKLSLALQAGSPVFGVLLSTKWNHARKNNVELRYIGGNISFDRLSIPMQTFIRVMGNLIDNAIEAIPNDDEIREVHIRARETPEAYEFSVYNTGSYIPPELRTRIFEPGFTTKSRFGHKDRGCGLSIVKEYVTTYGGQIEVQSEKKKGTTFIIRFPKSDFRMKVN